MSRLIYCYAECHYAECIYGECRGAQRIVQNSTKSVTNFLQDVFTILTNLLQNYMKTLSNFLTIA
jgi:hypothetical protein